MTVTNRNRTKVLVVVHSHNSPEPINLSADVIAMRTSKTVKNTGGMTLTLVPRKNYFNYLFPNDVINVYVNPGDGKRGYVRLFMGYIDRVDRTEQTNEHGAVNSGFNVICSDFQKAFERTNIYFNPHIENRKDLIDEALGGGTLLGGITLRTLGVRAHGTPADMIENLANMLLGFGSQWVLPESYDTTSQLVTDNRIRRKNRAKARLPKNLINSFTKWVMDLNLFEAGEIEGEEAIAKALAESRKEIPAGEFSLISEGKLALSSYQRAAQGVNDGIYSLIDLLDFSFIEAAAIDGHITSTGIWTKQGFLLQLMRAFSNNIVNELLFDLRPVAVSRQENAYAKDSTQFMDRCFGDSYYRGPDELGYNAEDKFEGFEVDVPAVAYVPAIVFREYPWSYVEGVNAGNLMALDKNPLGFVPFGPVFSTRDAKGDRDQYRAIYSYNDVEEIKEGIISVSSIGCSFSEVSEPLKHLDVVTIHDTDVVNSNVGRSDNDVYNVYNIYAENAFIENYKFILSHFMPLSNAVSIARNGLRVRDISTRFANYGRDSPCKEEGNVSNQMVIRNTIRWLMLIDHWEQHNNEYLSGEIVLRGMPEIRVGYRLDWRERRESYYVEAVSHQWTYPKEMMTSVKVSRGQRNDPYPAYIPPKNLTISKEGIGLGDGGNRDSDGRLGEYFQVLNTPATYNALGAEGSESTNRSTAFDGANENIIDIRPSPFSGVTIYSGEKHVRDPNAKIVSTAKQAESPEEEEQLEEDYKTGSIEDGVWPVAVDATLGDPVISDEYGAPGVEKRDGDGHQGVDIMYNRVPPVPGDFQYPTLTPRYAMPNGKPALACASGKIWSVRHSAKFGIEVTIDHGFPWLSVYRHLATVNVEKGDYVDKAHIIGTIGSALYKPDAINHMHFELWDFRRNPDKPAKRLYKAVDPEPFLNNWPKVTV